jgi:hypothetical protein
VRRHGLDPFAYFEWVFEKLMHNPSEEEFENLLPESWIKCKRHKIGHLIRAGYLGDFPLF